MQSKWGEIHYTKCNYIPNEAKGIIKINVIIKKMRQNVL